MSLTLDVSSANLPCSNIHSGPCTHITGKGQISGCQELGFGRGVGTDHQGA